MRDSWAPRILRPDYTWPCPMRGPIRTTTPPTPRVPSRFRRKLIGYVHTVLIKLSEWYCAWFEIPCDSSCMQLPFGLVMKQTNRVSIEEFAAMKMARAAGMPVPKVLSCGEHYSRDNDKRIVTNDGARSEPINIPLFSILMTRLPGIDLVNSDADLAVEIEEPWLWELRECILAMRQWNSPYCDSICSALGTQIHSIRVPFHCMGPFSDQDELYHYLFHPATSCGSDSVDKFVVMLDKAKELRQKHHRITFTHGDFQAHNIMVGDDGHLSGFLDWESGGWYPEYWDFTTAMRLGPKTWWGQTAAWMGGDRYTKELDADSTLLRLTGSSWAFW